MDLRSLSDSQQAVRLVYKGMRPSQSAARDPDYAGLIARYDADPAFRTQVSLHAAMLDLAVVDATPMQIMLRPSCAESLFRITLAQTRGSHAVRNSGLFALALVAVGAAFYRSGTDLAGTGAGLQMTVEQIEEILTDLCERIAAGDGAGDPPDAGEDAAETWRVIRAMARTGEGEGRAGFSNRTAIVRQAVNALLDHNMLREDRAGAVASYLPTERLRVQMGEVLASQLYRSCIGLLGMQKGTGENAHA
jgi:hypothetical protein